MRTLRLASIVLLLTCTACGGGGGDDDNSERVIATLAVSYNFSTAPSLDPYPFCFGTLTCAAIVVQDQFGAAVPLVDLDENTQPGEQPIVRAGVSGFGFLTNGLTDNQDGPLVATFMVNGQVPGCIDAMESDLVLQESRPVPGVDLVGFDVTGISLDIDTVTRSPTQVAMTGRVLIYGQTAAAP
ncbi:MAG: hypothetical protein QNJ98_15550 [Planctomycetota bacterium]|nr:hypothetical protein [Planctomycetota bacterium]